MDTSSQKGNQGKDEIVYNWKIDLDTKCGVGDIIAYIQLYEPYGDIEPRFRLLLEPIKKIVITYSEKHPKEPSIIFSTKSFHRLQYDELASNTNIVLITGLILTQEPFFWGELSEETKKAYEKWIATEGWKVEETDR